MSWNRSEASIFANQGESTRRLSHTWHEETAGMSSGMSRLNEQLHVLSLPFACGLCFRFLTGKKQTSLSNNSLYNFVASKAAKLSKKPKLN